MRELHYIYLTEGPEKPIGYEEGMLLWMDMNPDREWVRDKTGRFGPSWHKLLEDDTHDISYAARTVNALIKKGWVEVTSWTERMAPAAVRRSAKAGDSPYGADC